MNNTNNGGRNKGSKNRMTPKSKELLLNILKESELINLDKLIGYVDYDKRFSTLKPYLKILCTGNDNIAIETRKLIFEALKDEFKPNRFRTYFNQLDDSKKAIELRQYLHYLSPEQIEEVFKNMSKKG